jgi:diadenosine tetraphosphate (Ap4A) HIT family hydrolase
MSGSCPFCGDRESVFENDLARVVYDKYPVTTGHMLVIPKRHYADIFDSTREELEALLFLVMEAKTFLDEKHHPSGFNVGVNCGRAAGQSVMHVHIHVIPRYEGDLFDPLGGVRGVIPDKRKYG